jgi:PHD/YefM family antitoxin component YafN of YafNO toxin-antitoxin module
MMSYAYSKAPNFPGSGPMAKTLPVSEFRGRLGSLAYLIAQFMSQWLSASKGEPKGVLVSQAEYESWKATLDVLSNKEEIEGIEQGLADLRAGRTVSFEELFGEPVDGSECKRGKISPQRV